MSFVSNNNIYIHMAGADDLFVPEEIKEHLLSLLTNREKTTTINLFIDSDGTLVEEALGVYHLLEALKATGFTLRTFGQGNVSSGAILWMICGTERYALPHTRSLIHEPDSSMSGVPLSTLHTHAGTLNLLWNQYLQGLSDHTTLTINEVEAYARVQTTLIGQELVEAGFVDKILSPLDLAELLYNQKKR